LHLRALSFTLCEQIFSVKVRLLKLSVKLAFNPVLQILLLFVRLHLLTARMLFDRVVAAVDTPPLYIMLAFKPFRQTIVITVWSVGEALRTIFHLVIKIVQVIQSYLTVGQELLPNVTRSIWNQVETLEIDVLFMRHVK